MEQVKRKYNSKKITFNSDGELICIRCKNFKDTSFFDYHPSAPNRNFKDTRCKQCKSEESKLKREELRGSSDLNKLLKSRFKGLIDRANKAGLEVNIDLEFLHSLWVKQEGKCAISDIQMTYIFADGRIPTNVSVDRINSLQGYTLDNIQLVCMAVNQMKSDLTMEQLLHFCKTISSKWNK